MELVGERGYEQITVRELTGRAQVSQATLYQRFAGREACFLDVYEQAVRCAAQAVFAAQRRSGDRRERLRLAFNAFVEACARKPQAAHFALVDCFSSWPLARERMAHAGGLFEALLTDCVAAAPDGGVEPPSHLASAIVAGIASVVRERLLAGRADELGELGGELAGWADSLLSEDPGELGRLRELQVPPPSSAAGFGQAGHDDRSLLLSAVTKLAAAEGYRQLTVPRVRAAAGVSRRTFDSQFDDVASCFQAALERHSDEVLAELARVARSREDWVEATCATIAALCGLARDERLARTMFVEIFALGPAGVRCRAWLVAELAAQFRASVPRGQRPSVVAAEASMGAIWALLRAQVVAGRPARMTEIVGALAFIALAPCSNFPPGARGGRRGRAR